MFDLQPVPEAFCAPAEAASRTMELVRLVLAHEWLWPRAPVDSPLTDALMCSAMRRRDLLMTPDPDAMTLVCVELLCALRLDPCEAPSVFGVEVPWCWFGMERHPARLELGLSARRAPCLPWCAPMPMARAVLAAWTFKQGWDDLEAAGLVAAGVLYASEADQVEVFDWLTASCIQLLTDARTLNQAPIYRHSTGTIATDDDVVMIADSGGVLNRFRV